MPCVKRKKDDRKYDKNDKTYEEKFREIYPPSVLIEIDGIQNIIQQNHFHRLMNCFLILAHCFGQKIYC